VYQFAAVQVFLFTVPNKPLSPIQSTGLLRRHKLRLITTSLACERSLQHATVTAYQAAVDGDAMAADISSVMASQAKMETASKGASNSPAMKVVAKVEPLSPLPTSSPSEIVSNSLSAAAAAAAAAAASAAGTVASVAAPIATPIASNISYFASSVSSATTLRPATPQLQTAAVSGQSSAYAAVSAAVESAMTHNDRKAKRVSSSEDCSSPTHWFIVDDDEARVRMFVIQGSDNMDHWKVNLTFDPVPFEDAELGVKVHRGVYEAAQVLYDRFLPLVQDHLATSPTARVAFTGHSLGGSLGTLLMMMYVRRGVIDPANLAPVYTFGSPSVLCDGECENGVCPPSGEEPRSALARLGLPVDSVRNVMMHKDIVPRAFACDFSKVSEILKRVHDSFREHKFLSGNRQVLYKVVGKVMVLQPSGEASFVNKEGYHALLPDSPGLYVVRDANVQHNVAAQVGRDARAMANAVSHTADPITNLPAMARSMAVPTPSTPATAADRVANASEAVWHLMNTPHPLDILSDPGAYGDTGSISRYHNPDNYTRAIGGVLRSRGAASRALVANATRAGVQFRPSVITSPPVVVAEDNAEGMVHGSNPNPGGGKMHLPTVRAHHHAESGRPSFAPVS